MSDRFFNRVLRDAHDADIIDLRRRGDDFEGAALGYYGSRGETPPMLSAAHGQLEALAWFEAQGADLWARDPQGKNALDWARFRQQAEAEAWLLRRRSTRLDVKGSR